MACYIRYSIELKESDRPHVLKAMKELGLPEINWSFASVGDSWRIIYLTRQDDSVINRGNQLVNFYRAEAVARTAGYTVSRKNMANGEIHVSMRSY